MGDRCANYEKGSAALIITVTYDGAGRYEVGVVHDTTRR